MALASKRERRLWLAAGLCILLIYCSLYIARPIAELLRERNLLRVAVVSVFASAAAVIAWRWLVARPGWRVLATLAAVGLGYLLLLTRVPMAPEEALHFLEYGLVAALIYRALRERRSRWPQGDTGARDLLVRLPPMATAVVLTGLVGWLDEGIQAMLPNRVYDLRDVAFNTVAAVVCVGSIKVVERVQQSEY